MCRFFCWFAFFTLCVPCIVAADVATDLLIADCDKLFDRDAPYEEQIAKATAIRELGLANKDDELVARGSIRMMLIEIHTGKWTEGWEALRDEAIELTEGYGEQSVARIEVQALYGYMRAMYFGEAKQGISDLRSSISAAISLELDALLARAHFLLGRVAVFDEQELSSLESLRLSIQFARHAKNEWAEFQALRQFLYFSDALHLDVESELQDRFRQLCLKFKRKETVIMPDAERRIQMLERIEGYDDLRRKNVNDAVTEFKQAHEAARFLFWDFSKEENWDKVEKFLQIYEETAKLLDNESSQVECTFLRAGLQAREGNVIQAQETLGQPADRNLIYYRTPEGFIWMAEQFRAGGDDQQADEWYRVASATRDRDQITRASALSANAYFDSLMSDRRLRGTIRQQEKKLLNQRWLWFSLVLTGICMWLAQRTLHQRGRQKELQDRINEQTDSLRRAKEEAEAQNHAKTEYVARINHEIRNPLTAIVACSELLSDPRLAQEDRSEAQNTLRLSTENVLQLIGDVIDFSQVESGSLENCPNSFSPSELLSSVASMISPKLAAGVELRRNTSVNLPGSVLADETKVQQVLLNVAQNAVRHTPSGHIELGCHFAPAKTASEANCLRWTISDTGTGMTPEQIRSAFTQTTDQLTGTGLGLYISKSLVDCMQGSIECESEVGRGTVFTVCIPCEETESISSKSRPLLSAVKRDALSVLVFDDEPLNRNTLGKLLEKIGCDCEVAGTWSVAESLLTTKEFDVVLLDLRMPDMDGFEVFRRLHSLQVSHKPRVYAMTGDATETRRRQVAEAGFDGFLAKPFSTAKLSDIVHS